MPFTHVVKAAARAQQSMTPTLTLRTPAKINLFLNLRHPRLDGFHEVFFVMQAVALWDTLHITPWLDGQGIHLQCDAPALNETPADNLVVKAYQAFWEATGLPPMGLRVRLEKGIPVQAGLGGGSSDAAAMLVALNHLTCAQRSPTELRTIAARLGSDVPFFISGGTAVATGRGEIIQPLLTPLAPTPMVIIKPRDLDIPTPKAYQAYRVAGRYHSLKPDALLEGIKQGHGFETWQQELHNDFESVLFPRYPQLSHMVETLQALGVRRPLLSGSGPTVVAFTPHSKALAAALAEHFPPRSHQVFWTHTHAQAQEQGETTGLS